MIMVVFNGLKRKRSRIGLDIGASGVRAVQLTRSAGGYELTNAASGDRSSSEPGAQATGQDLALGDRIGTVIRTDRGGRVRFHGKDVAVALATPDVEFHTLELPAAVFHADEAEAEQIVKYEVERLMTGQQSRVETRHWRLPQTVIRADQGGRVCVPAPNAIGTGAAHETINRTIEVCAKAGLTCSHLDTTATALARFGAVLQCRPKDQVWGVLDVGDRQARLTLCLEDTPILVRTAGAGGHAWTQRIADALQLSFKAAEIHKRDHGIALTGRQTRDPADEGTRSELASLILGALRADLNDLASEVKRSYEYVLGCYPGRRAADLVLCGGGSLLHHFPEFLGEALGIPVRRASSYLQSELCRLGFVAEGVGRRDRQTSRPRVRRRDQGGSVREGPGGSVHASLEVLAVAVGLAISE